MQARKEPAPAGSWGAEMLSVFESADRAHEAIGKLERGGFDTSMVSIIGKEEPSVAHQLGFAVAGGHARAWGQRSALWNRLAEAPAAMALAWVPFIGHIMAVGPAARVLVGSDWKSWAHPRTSALAKMLTLAGMSASECAPARRPSEADKSFCSSMAGRGKRAGRGGC